MNLLSFLPLFLLLNRSPIVDDRGKVFDLSKTPRRIVSLAPSLTEMVVKLGLEDRLVGVTLWDTAYLKGKKVIVGSQGMINDEMILLLNPNIALAAGITSEEETKRLEELGVRVFALLGHDIDGILKDLVKLGKLLGVENKSKRLADSLRKEARRLEKCVKGGKRVKVFFLIDTHGGLWTAGKGTFIDDLVKRAGGINVFDEVEGWKSISMESLLLKDPEVIILGWGADSSILHKNPLNELSAVKKGKVFRPNDPDILSRPGIRVVEALRWLVQKLHPHECD